MSVERWLILVCVAAVAPGCGRKGAAVSGPSSRASSLPVAGLAAASTSPAGRRYRSVDELEGGLGPHGVERMHWRLSFGKQDGQGRGDFTWDYSDVRSRGWYRLTNNRILTDSQGGNMPPDRYDAAADRVLWQGRWYARDGG